MTRNLKATYEKGKLRLQEPLPVPDGTQISRNEDNGERSQGMTDQSWDALTQLLAECAIDTGIPDLAHRHDRYLYGISEKP